MSAPDSREPEGWFRNYYRCVRTLRPRMGGRVVVPVRRRLSSLRRPAHVAIKSDDLSGDVL